MLDMTCLTFNRETYFLALTRHDRILHSGSCFDPELSEIRNLILSDAIASTEICKRVFTVLFNVHVHLCCAAIKQTDKRLFRQCQPVFGLGTSMLAHIVFKYLCFCVCARVYKVTGTLIFSPTLFWVS